MAFIVNQHNQRFAYIALIAVLSALGQCAEWCKYVPTGVWGEVSAVYAAAGESRQEFVGARAHLKTMTSFETIL